MRKKFRFIANFASKFRRRVPERKILSIPNFGLDDGVKELNRRIRKLSDSKKIVVIGVSGPTGAGKTFVAQKLHGATLSMDRYYKRIKRLDKGNWDKSRALYLSLLRKNLIRLKQGLPAKVPVWDNVTHSRKGFETLFPPKVLIVEGLHALHPKIIDLLDLKVFVEAPKDIRLQRRLERDEKDRGGWTRESDIEYFHKISEPMYRKHIVPRRAHADLIITT